MKRVGTNTLGHALPAFIGRRAPDTIYIGINDRDPAWHDLYRLRLSNGSRELVRRNTERLTELYFDNDDRLRLATRIADDGSSELLRIEGDLTRLTLLNVDTGAEELIESDPLKRVDLGAPIFSRVTGKLVGTLYMDDRQRFYWRDADWERDYRELVARLPGKELYPAAITRDEQIILLTASADTEPGETYIYDRRTRQLAFQFRIREDHHRGRSPPRRAGNRRPSARRDHGLLVRRLLCARGRGIHAGSVLGRSRHRRAFQPGHIPRRTAAVCAGVSQDHLQPHRRSSHSGGPRAARSTVAERFLAQHVRGVRYQESMSADAAARLKAVER